MLPYVLQHHQATTSIASSL